MPVIGFNSGSYNLIKEHFVERIVGADQTIEVAKKANKVMFLQTSNFRFLDIINYLGPGTSYEKWVKAYRCLIHRARVRRV